MISSCAIARGGESLPHGASRGCGRVAIASASEWDFTARTWGLSNLTLPDDKVCYRLVLAVRAIRSYGGGMNGIVRVRGGRLSALTVPEILIRAGANALFAAEEFFKATVNNAHTKRAYTRAIARFLAWCERSGVRSRRAWPARGRNARDRNRAGAQTPAL